MSIVATIDTSRLQPMLRRASRIQRANLKRVMVRGGERILAQSQREVPRRTGFLANSRFLRVEDTRTTIAVTIGYSAPYAIFVENAPPGTRFRVGKRHYLRDPVNRNRRRILREMKQALVVR